MIDLARRGGLWIVTLNRPDKANALNSAMLTQLLDLLGEAEGKARALVLTGAGATFSAGADLNEVRSGTLATSPLWEAVSGRIAAASCLTIAALNGTLAGGAFGMALACDLRVAVPAARFFYPVMKLGVLPQPSDPARLKALIGPARAKLILMARARLTAEQALAMGLIDSIADDAMTAAQSLAADALAADPAHVAAIKRMI